MQPDDVRVHHLIEAATKAIDYTNRHQRSDLESDEVLRLALTKLVEIVGEAAKQVTDETRAMFPDVPWSAAARMRDRLVHHYFDIDLDVLWSTITLELPKVLDRLNVESEGQSRGEGSGVWTQVSLLLRSLTEELSAWAAVVLVPKPNRDALYCAANYQLPEDWAKLDNPLNSGSMNARAYLSQQEVIDNDAVVTVPPSNQEVSHHTITASAVVLIPDIGTLEVLANKSGYRFEERQLQTMRSAASEIARILAET